MNTSDARSGPEQPRQPSVEEWQPWLAEHSEARLDYPTSRGPRSVVVKYAMGPDQVLLRLPTYHDILQYAPGQRVTLEVDGGAAGGGCSRVLVTGTAERADRALVSEYLRPLEEEWPPELPTDVVRVPIAEVSLVSDTQL